MSSKQDSATQWKLITQGTVIGNTLKGRDGNKRAIRGFLCISGSSATLTDQGGNSEPCTVVPGIVYPMCPAEQTAGDAVLVALYGD